MRYCFHFSCSWGFWRIRLLLFVVAFKYEFDLIFWLIYFYETLFRSTLCCCFFLCAAPFYPFRFLSLHFVFNCCVVVVAKFFFIVAIMSVIVHILLFFSAFKKFFVLPFLRCPCAMLANKGVYGSEKIKGKSTKPSKKLKQ